MHYDLRILGPVLLILLAGYLASNPTPLESSSLVTGLSVKKITDCEADRIVLKLSGQNNAHAAVYNFNHAAYTHAVCAEKPLDSKDRICVPDGKNTIVKLSAENNAHAQQKDKLGYSINVCYGQLQCSYTTACKPASRTQCLGSLSADTNAHIGRCADYPIKICCTEGSAQKKDTDKDGVYDDEGTKPCNPKIHNNFKTCKDNCIGLATGVGANGPDKGTCIGGTNNAKLCDPKQTTACPGGICEAGQKDTDGDGAGDVCDDFPNDWCSIAKKGDYSLMHPNDHVNMGQSSNNVVPSAMKIAAYKKLNELILILVNLQKNFLKKMEYFAQELDKIDYQLNLIYRDLTAQYPQASHRVWMLYFMVLT